MGQKVHPLGFRLGISQEHKSEWFAKPKQYAQFVAEDAFIRKLFTTRLHEAGVTDIRIERLADQFQVKVILYISRPRILIDANGKNTLGEISGSYPRMIRCRPVSARSGITLYGSDTPFVARG